MSLSLPPSMPGYDLGKRNPSDTGFARVQLGTYWLPDVQYVAAEPPTITSCSATANPTDVTLQNQQMQGTDFYFRPVGGTGGLVYDYLLSIGLSDGQSFVRTVTQACVG